MALRLQVDGEVRQLELRTKRWEVVYSSRRRAGPWVWGLHLVGLGGLVGLALACWDPEEVEEPQLPEVVQMAERDLYGRPLAYVRHGDEWTIEPVGCAWCAEEGGAP